MTQIGAVLNIDPGQSQEKIDKSFDAMKACGMTVCRIILDSAYGPNACDIYDPAFSSAASRCIGIVVSLRGKLEFCTSAVRHFKPHKALLAWEIESGRNDLGDMVKSEDPSHELITCGLSLLPGVDLPDTDRKRYTVALSAQCDVVRSKAGSNPFWVTSLQGGSNLYTGTRCFSPSAGEIAQWLWTSVASGARGVFLQSVNSKKDGEGAGEMSLLNMQGGKTVRSEAVREVISTLDNYETLFSCARPSFSPVTMLYTRESLLAENTMHREDLSCSDYEVRQKGGTMKDAIAIYQILMERGIRADFREISEYAWNEDSKGKCIIFAGQLSVPTVYYPKIREFVKNGGKVIIEGLSFCYDERMNSVFSSDFPLKDVFGGYVEEYMCRPGNYKIRIDGKRMWVHLFDGILHNEASGESLRILRNKYGRGNVLWIPSVIGMGALREGHINRISKFFKKELDPIVREMPLTYKRRHPGICLQVMETEDEYITVLTSSKKHRCRVGFKTQLRIEKRLFYNEINYKTGKAKNRKVKIHPGQTVVALWKKTKIDGKA